MPKKINSLDLIEKSFEIVSKKPAIIGAFVLPLAMAFVIASVSVLIMVQSLLQFDFYPVILSTALLIFSLWLAFFGVGGIVLSAAKIAKGRKVNFSEVSDISFRNCFRLLAAYALEEIFIMLGLVAFIIPGIFLAVRLVLTVPGCILEKRGLGVGKSWAATRGNFWKISLVLLIWVGMFLVVGIIPIFSILAIILFLPVYLTTLTLLYLRLKK